MTISIADQIKGRWKDEYDSHPLGMVAKTHMHRLLDAHEQIIGARDTLAKDRNLSDIGRKEKLRDIAKQQAPRVAKAERALAAARDKIRADRHALTPQVQKKGDVAAALLRREYRDKLASKSPAEMVALLNNPATPTAVLEAVYEAPFLVQNIPPEVYDRLLSDIMQRTDGPAVADLQEQSDALDMMRVALDMAAGTLQDVVGVAPSAFRQWLDTAAPIDKKEAADEAAQIAAETITKSANALPLAARLSLVDSLLATNVAEIRVA